MRVFLDFEASSLSDSSYPIEVGWVFEDGAEEAHLIAPAPAWEDWDAASEAVHGISRATLLTEGEPHDVVADRMLEALSGHDLFASAPSWDGKWLSALLRAAGRPRHALRLRGTDEALRESAMRILQPALAAHRVDQEVHGLVARIAAIRRLVRRLGSGEMTDADELGLPAHAFDRQDGGDDLGFYAPPRLVTHIDEGAVAALTGLYRDVIPHGGRVLDLMSSWISHLPDDVAYAEVIGHGMNSEELATNPRLDRWFVQDLNETPVLPEVDGRHDAVLVCVGVQYLQRPLAVLREVRRVLVPGGVVIVSFSNRCFPTKAVAVWRSLDLQGHAALVRLYLEKAGFHDVAASLLADGRRGDPLVAVAGRA